MLRRTRQSDQATKARQTARKSTGGSVDVVDFSQLRKQVSKACRATAMKADIEAKLREEERKEDEALGLSPTTGRSPSRSPPPLRG